MSIRLKTILGVALIEGVLLLVLLYMMMNFIRDSNNEALIKRANTAATLFATTTKDAVLSFDLASLEAFVQEVMTNPDLVYARVVDPQGIVFAVAGNTDHQAGDTFSFDSDSASVTDDIFDVQADIVEGGHVYGRVQIGLDVASINQSIDKVYTWGKLLASGEMLLVALFSFLLGGYLTGQLAKLRRAALAISEGDFDTRVVINGKDEVAVVGQAFNLMGESLSRARQERDSYEQQLLELNRSLEQRVEKRTEQLASKNQQLEEALESLQQAQQKLLQSEKMAGLGTMAAGVAHEINNPVSFVKSNLASLGDYSEQLLSFIQRSDKLMASQQLPEPLLQALARERERADIEFLQEDIGPLVSESLEGVERVQQIVSGLKSFSRVDDDSFTPEDINQGIQATLKMAANQLKYHCQVHEQYAELPKLNCNIAKLNQVFLNMLVNAAQAIEDKGHIYIKTALLDETIQVIIQDTGSGMSDEVKKQLFDPFFTTKAVGEGTGLGMSISHGIVEEHGGRIDVKSVLGKGTQFVINLPLKMTAELKKQASG